MSEIREPKKINSIDKKKRIIEAGLKLFARDGYYKTNTAEIAKEAGVSTGIVYNYFIDKKDILLYAIEIYFEKIQADFKAAFEEASKHPFNVNYKRGDVFKVVVPMALASHKEDVNVHKQMLALSLVDNDIQKAFKENKEKMVHGIELFVSNYPINTDHIKEKAAMSFQIVEGLMIEAIYNPFDEIDENALIESTIKALSSLFID